MGAKGSKSIRDATNDDDGGYEPILMLPDYYVKDPVTEEDISLARNSWDLVLKNKAEGYLSGEYGCDEQSCGQWYCRQFFDSLFEMEPKTESLFKKSDMMNQSLMLYKMISFLVENIDRQEQLAATLCDLAVRHSGYGVKCGYYGIFGEVLLMTLEKVLGRDYNEQVANAWIRIYSSVLRIILPAAVEEERRAWLMRCAKGYAEPETKSAQKYELDTANCFPFGRK